MIKKSLAIRLLSVVTALAVLPLLWPASVSAGWWGGLFHKKHKNEYDPVKISPHCQQYYGYFPTCWRIFPRDFQNCPPGEICPGGMISPNELHAPGESPMPVDVPMPEPADGAVDPGDSFSEPAPAVPPADDVPYEEPTVTPEPSAAPEAPVTPDVPATPDVPDSIDLPTTEPQDVPAPVDGDESSSNLFLPPTVNRDASTQWETREQSPRTSAKRPMREFQRRAPLVRLGKIETDPQADGSFETPLNEEAYSASPVALPIPAGTEGEIAELLHALSDPHTVDRHKIIYRLGLMKQQAAPAVPALTVLLQDADAKTRMHSALALWRITQKTEFAVPTLSSGLNNEGQSVQSLAAVALGEIGPAAEDAVPSLVSASENAEVPSKLQAAEALWKVAGKNANSIAVLVTSLEDADADVRWVAAYALAEISPQSQVAVKTLTERLVEDENARVREVSAFALGAIGTTAKTAVPQLLEAMNDESPGVRDAATRALLLIDP